MKKMIFTAMLMGSMTLGFSDVDSSRLAEAKKLESTAFETSKFDDAILAYEDLLTSEDNFEDRNTVEATFRLANLYLNNKQIKKAFEKYMLIVKKAPADSKERKLALWKLTTLAAATGQPYEIVENVYKELYKTDKKIKELLDYLGGVVSENTEENYAEKADFEKEFKAQYHEFAERFKKVRDQMKAKYEALRHKIKAKLEEASK